MHLHRVTPDAFEIYKGEKYLGQSADNFTTSTLGFGAETTRKVVITRFERFGGGERRQSDFEVIAEWEDVEKIIDTFCEAQHPQALALRAGAKLAAAAEKLGWRAPASD